MAEIVVAGAGMVGAGVALMLARRGHHVHVVDRDAGPRPGSPDDDFNHWDRPGVPQFEHGHVYRARMTRVLSRELPDLIDAALGRGIIKVSNTFGDGYEDDFALAARRPVLEGVLRRALLTEPRTLLYQGVHIAGLTARPGTSRPRITGIRIDDDTIPADLVIDACGRRSRAPHWLTEHGAQPPVEEYHPCGLHYFARHYRLRHGAALPSTVQLIGELAPYGIFLAMPGDNDTFALAGAVSNDDPLRAHLRDGAIFDRVMAALPAMAAWADAGEPLTDVALMAGLANRRRSMVRDGAAVADGFAMVGDSSIYTNATVGQGIALGIWQAQTLARLTEDAATVPADLAEQLEAWTNHTLRPRFDTQAGIDAAMVSTLRAGSAGHLVTHAIMTTGIPSLLGAMAAGGDPDAAVAFDRLDNLLTTPEEEMQNPQLRDKVQTFRDATAGQPPPAPNPLPRNQFEAILQPA